MQKYVSCGCAIEVLTESRDRDDSGAECRAGEGEGGVTG